jgi:hypothetical protein
MSSLSAESIVMESAVRVMESAVRLVRQVQITLLVTIALCVVAGEMTARAPAHYRSNTLFHALSLISISLVGATVVVRRTLILPSEILLKERLDDSVADDSLSMSRWRTGYLFLYALCELLGLFGLGLRLAGFPLANVWGFYLGGFLLLLLYSPRAPHAPAGLH